MFKRETDRQTENECDQVKRDENVLLYECELKLMTINIICLSGEKERQLE